MATLTRPKYEATAPPSSVSDTIPSPFPRHQLHSLQRSEQRPRQERQQIVEREAEQHPFEDVQEESTQQETEQRQAVRTDTITLDLVTSIANVQKTCLMALNDLLSSPAGWSAIVPERRHSMPTGSQPLNADAPMFSALQTLVANLRSRDPQDSMIEAPTSDVEDDAALIKELDLRVSRLSHTLPEDDSQLAMSIVSLLSYLRRISTIMTSSPQPSSSKSARAELPPDFSDYAAVDGNLFATLKRELSDFQSESIASRRGDTVTPGAPPVLAVETALLWSRIDEELETVLSLSKGRSYNYAPSERGLPPQYDDWSVEDEFPPDYKDKESILDASFDDTKRSPAQSVLTHSGADKINEKMRLDFEAVTMAIDRLYINAPQLHNQRVELKSSKLLQMEMARNMGPTQAVDRKGKQKAVDMDVKELEKMFELIGKASERKYTDQTVILQGGMKSQLEKAQVRDRVKRDAFVEKLALHSDAGRYHEQDATLLPGARMRDPEALLTLPEFVRETVPLSHQVLDQEAMLTLPEFIRESQSQADVKSAVPEGAGTLPAHARRFRMGVERRTRSMSAPSLSWLRSSSSRSHLNAEVKASGMVAAASDTPLNSSRASALFEVNYVAEHHENLHHVLVFLAIQGAPAGSEISVEVLPSLHNIEEGDRMIVRSGPLTSLPLLLPAYTAPGRKEVRIQSSHYEVKIPTLPSSTPSASEIYHQPLLDATQLTSLHPTTFICSSCSLPLVQASKVDSYRDLPSEHWEELVDAWMCHPDMKLNEEITKRKDGFWPAQGEALVGGSYILFGEDVTIGQNIAVAKETKHDQGWRAVRCICGSVVGRSQPRRSDPSDHDVYRLVKYAIRPFSAKSESLRIPLSAFIIEDLNELVQAHASYRFVIMDEEDEKPRLLMWLFKPSMRIAYATSRHYSMPKSASIHGAKVLYKILKPEADEQPVDLKTVVSKYPGFPQAEHLFYPISICRRIAGILKESTGAYPDSMRTMTGLDVGWLARA